MILFNSRNEPISLGKEIGRGGEGIVSEVVGKLGLVAKHYVRALSPDKQQKLRSMISIGDGKLREVTAWPLDTLHSHAGGPVCGFMMPHIANRIPIHELYSPNSRKQKYPDLGWNFLVYAARNIAFAFDIIHQNGIVVGDVNYNLVMIGSDCHVRLIDCDSFQLTIGPTTYTCDVGVPEYTAPELQGASFAGKTRTVNHDLFGMAVLIFQTLMLGRHPFAGVYEAADLSLQQHIERHDYFYSKNAIARGLGIPPGALSTEVFSERIAETFERTFSKDAIQNGRPSATEWLNELESFTKTLTTCSLNRRHFIKKTARECPFCRLETTNGFFPFQCDSATNHATSSLQIAKCRSLLAACIAPPPLPSINVDRRSIVGKPMPKELTGFFGFFKFQERADLRKKRQTELTAANQAYFQLEAQWKSEASNLRFDELVKAITRAIAEYEGLEGELKQKIDQVRGNLRKSQLNAYLRQVYISNSQISGIGSSRKAVLASFGIETAADVNRQAISRIKGFGDVLTKELVDWRARVEAKFVYKPSPRDGEQEVSQIRAQIAARASGIQKTIESNLGRLEPTKNEILSRRRYLQPLIEAAAKRKAQAEADYANCY